MQPIIDETGFKGDIGSCDTSAFPQTPIQDQKTTTTTLLTLITRIELTDFNQDVQAQDVQDVQDVLEDLSFQGF